MSASRSGVCERVFLLFLLFSLNLISTPAQVPARVPAPVDNAVRIMLAGNVHPLARAEFDRGAVAGSQPMPRILLLLQRSDAQEAALQTFLEQQQDKSSPNYHQWLAPSEFGAQYGPADSDVQAVTQWLESQGFTVAKVYSSKMMIEFSGTAAQVQAAFGTPIHNFEVNGKTYVANASNPQIPAALAPVVAGIVSLNNFPRQSHVRVAGQARKIAGQTGLQPLFTFPLPLPTGGTETFYGVGPADFATIYNSQSLIASGNDGTGQTIAIVGETNINVTDVQQFRQMFGLSANFTSANVILNGEDPGITSTDEEGEADLDTQWSGAVAPGATIEFVVSATTPASQGIDLSALYIVEYNLAGVMSESYGACESALGTTGIAFYNSLWEQAAAQGITVALSAGDGGSAGCDDFNTATVATQGLAVSGLASTPYNVALGGTDFDDAANPAVYWSANNNATTGASALGYIPEIPWNQNCAQLGLAGCGATAPQGSVNIVAGSGGASNVYPKPKWQMGITGMPNDSHRDVPDLSLFASAGFDGSGYVICQSGLQYYSTPCNLAGGFYGQVVGGTSAAAPAFAGIMALVNQYQSAHGGGTRQGNANPVLYSLAKKSGASCISQTGEASTCIFNDVTHGNSYLRTYYPDTLGTNSVPCQGGTPNCSANVSTATGVLVAPTSPSTEAWTVGTGYDLVTGLGSVNINNLVTKWGTVNTVPTTTTLTLNPTTGITHGIAEDVTVNISVTPTSGTATGNVSLIATLSGPSGSTTQGLDQFTLDSTGKIINGTTNSLPGGSSYQVYAHYAGDGTNAPSDSAPVTVTVGKESSQTFIVIPTFDLNGNLTNGNATSVPYASNFIINAYVTDKNAAASSTGPPTPACYQENMLTCPTGTVTLTDNGNALGTGGGGAGIYNVNSSGQMRSVPPILPGGSYTLAASYSGDNSYQSSTSATTTLTVAPGNTQAQILNTVSSIVEGQQIYISGQVTANSSFPLVTLATPTGSLALYDGNTALPGVSTTAGGGQMNAFLATAFSTPGPHSITAKYSGDSNYAASTSSPFIISSLYPVTVAETASATTITYGQTITVTAVISSGIKGPAMTGQVQFMGMYQVGPITTTAGTDANGNEILTATATTTPQNSESLEATYSGDSTYGPAVSPALPITVNIPNFSFGPTGITVQPQAGQGGSAQITITPANPTQCTVTLSTGVPPGYFSGYTLAINPPQVTLNGSPVTATISFTPNTATPSIAQKASVRHASILPVKRGNWWLLSLAAAITAVFWLTRSGRRKKLRTALALSIASLFFLALGCGGGGGSSGGSGGGSGGPPQATSIALTTTNAKIPINTPGTITATVTASKPLSGTISFYNFGQLIDGPIPAYSGQAQMNIETLGPGQYQLTAAYSGDSENQSSTSGPLAQVVTGTITLNFQATTGSSSLAITRYLNVAIGVQ
jgi:Pro-kumamolisin, activation domain/Bacterial Ig-like domain (group 3)